MRLNGLLGFALLAFVAACGKADLVDQQASALGAFPKGQTLMLTGTVTEPTYSGDIVWRAMRPDLMRFQLSLGPDQSYEQGWDGKKSWEKPVANEKPYETKGAVRDAVKRDAAWLGNYRPLKEFKKLGAIVQERDPEMIDGVAFDKIEVTFPEGDTASFYLDRTSHLVVRSRMRKALHPSANEPPEELETILEDWRKIGKLNVAFRETVREVATGKVVQTVQWKQAMWEPADKKSYAMPKK
ncbi:MAG: hypothetical protein U1E87_07710 [Alphaproteobacteria bacterium]